MSCAPTARPNAVRRGTLLIRVVLLQLAVVTVSVLVARNWGEAVATAALMGGLNALVSSSLCGAIALYAIRGRSQRAILTGLFLGEAGKFLAVAVGFALIFHVAGPALSRVDTLVLFGVFALTLGAQGLAAAAR